MICCARCSRASWVAVGVSDARRGEIWHIIYSETRFMSYHNDLRNVATLTAVDNKQAIVIITMMASIIIIAIILFHIKAP